MRRYGQAPIDLVFALLLGALGGYLFQEWRFRQELREAKQALEYANLVTAQAIAATDSLRDMLYGMPWGTTAPEIGPADSTQSGR